MKKLLILAGFVLIAAGSLFAAAASEQLAQGNTLYQKGEYDAAIKAYEAIAAQDLESPALYYNLANAYYKTGHIAPAILNYERAHKLAPTDDDINFNLRLANTHTVDKIALIPEIFYMRWLNAIAGIAGPSAWAVLSILFFACCLAGFAFFVTAGTPAVKKTFFGLAILMFVFSALGFTVARQQQNEAQNTSEAIIFESSLYVKSSPDEKSTDLFILHEGTKVQLLDSLQNWRKIRLANGNVGWVSSESIKEI